MLMDYASEVFIQSLSFFLDLQHPGWEVSMAGVWNSSGEVFTHIFSSLH
jgi:hypothetical protein